MGAWLWIDPNTATNLSIDIQTPGVFSVVPMKFTAVTSLDVECPVIIWYLIMLQGKSHPIINEQKYLTVTDFRESGKGNVFSPE